MKKIAAEAVGTFLLVLVGTGSIILDQEGILHLGAFGIGVAFGVIVTAMILIFGKVSGSNINPAVSSGFFLLGQLDAKTLVQYMVAQFAGASGASLLLKGIFPANATLGATLPSGSEMESFLFEFFLTLSLMMVILVTAQGHPSLKPFAPFAIGATVFLEAWIAGPICGASMNPARSLGPAVVSGNLTSLWVYLVATTLGVIVASQLWVLLMGRDSQEKNKAASFEETA